MNLKSAESLRPVVRYTLVKCLLLPATKVLQDHRQILLSILKILSMVQHAYFLADYRSVDRLEMWKQKLKNLVEIQKF